MNNFLLKVYLKMNYNKKDLKKLKKKKLLPQLFPNKLEKESVKKIKQLIIDKILGKLLAFTKEDYSKWLQAKGFKADSMNFEDWIYGLLDAEFDIETELMQYLDELTVSLSIFTEKEITKSLSKIFVGIKFSNLGMLQLEEAKKSWKANYLNLISGLGEELRKKVGNTIETAVKQGWSYRDLAETLKEVYDFAENRAELIAKDQIGKFYTENTKVKQQDLGLDIYQWFAIGDERTCDVCGVLNNRYFKWSDGTVWSEDGRHWEKRPDEYMYLTPANAHPQCRCTALAYLDNVFEEIEEGIG